MNYLLQLDPGMRDEKSIIINSGLNYCRSSIDDLVIVPDVNTIIPVGSVEFIRKYASMNGIKLPENDTYPEHLRNWLRRPLSRTVFSSVPVGWFCKPVSIKSFTGALKEHIEEYVDPNEEVWCCPPVQFAAEFRVYVLDGTVIGYSRYDDGDNEEGLDMRLVEQMIADYADAPRGYSLDVGIANEEQCLVEVNDGWALGYYRWGNVGAKDYIDLITCRWQQILENS